MGNETTFLHITTFVLMNVCVLFTATRIAPVLCHSRRWHDQIPVLALLSCSLIILSEIILGHLHQLTARNLLIVHLTLAIITYFLKPRLALQNHSLSSWDPFSFFIDPGERYGVFIVAIFFSLLFVVQGLRFLISPPSHWDDLNYHLRFPVEWLQSGTIDNPIVPFGDLAPSYYPMNTELLNVWVMAPLKSDIIARILQHLFLGVGAVVAYGILRHIGSRRFPAVIITSSFFSMPYLMTQGHGFPVNGQTTSHDVTAMTFFLIWLFMLLRYLESPTRSGAILVGMSAGVYIGTKYISILYGIPLIGCFILHSLVSRCSFWEKIHRIICFLIPMMIWGSYFYLRNLVLTGNPLYPAQITLGGVTLFEGIYTAAHYQARSVHDLFSWREFLVYPAFGVGMVFAIMAGYISAVTITIQSCIRKTVLRLPLNHTLFLISLPVITFCLYYFLFPERNYRFLFVPLACAMITLGMNSAQGVRNELFGILMGLMVLTARRTIQLDTYPMLSGLHSTQYPTPILENRYAPGWRFLNEFTVEHPESRQIAYAGLNIPYPLYGREFQNRVRYVPVNNTGTRLHEYSDTHYRSPAEPYLWLDNLMEYDIRVLVCHKQLQQDISNAFPEEDHWATHFKPCFHRIYDDEHTHIYIVDRSGWIHINGNNGNWSQPTSNDDSGRFPHPNRLLCRPDHIVPGGMFDQITVWEIPEEQRRHQIQFHYSLSGITAIDRFYPEPNRTSRVIHRVLMNVPEETVPGPYSLMVHVTDQTLNKIWELYLGDVTLVSRDSIPPLPPPEIISPEPDSIVNERVAFEWTPVPGSFGYIVELTDPNGHTGRNRVFETSLELYSIPETLTGFRPGTYRWRVASWGAGGLIAMFSREHAFQLDIGASTPVSR